MFCLILYSTHNVQTVSGKKNENFLGYGNLSGIVKCNEKGFLKMNLEKSALNFKERWKCKVREITRILSRFKKFEVKECSLDGGLEQLNLMYFFHTSTLMSSIKTHPDDDFVAPSI